MYYYIILHSYNTYRVDYILDYRWTIYALLIWIRCIKKTFLTRKVPQKSSVYNEEGKYEGGNSTKPLRGQVKSSVYNEEGKY